MTVPKLRAAIVVFIVGFALGLSVFASSRLLVRSVLGAELEAAAVEVASRMAEAERVEARGTLSSVLRYAVFDANAELVRSVELGTRRESAGGLAPSSVQASAFAAQRGAPVVEHAPLLPALLGLIEPGVRGAAAPIIEDGTVTGAVYVEADQDSALESLTRAFGLVGIIAVSLAVLASVAITRGVTRGLGGSAGRTLKAGPRSRDPDTGLPNRSGFQAILDDSVAGAAQSDQQIGLMVIDLDGFRAVNNVWGHQVGDAVVKAIAERLRALASRPDCLSRIGADQFALIVDTDANSHGLRQVAERVRETLSTPVKVGDSAIAVGASIGAALFPVNADTADMLFRAADTALSKAKQDGRNTLAFFDTEMKKRMTRRTVLERDLRQALQRDEFVVFYQPQMELASGRVRGYEALVRWERPDEGILAPREFLPVAEETGLIRPLGEWVLRKACTDAAGWLDGSIVAVNFSAAQFRFQELDATIAKVLADTRLPAERLEIEVPESLFLEHTPEVMNTLNAIKALGVRVAMDDFGSGYSGLASLAHFPFDKIKIDRSFVGQLTEDSGVAAIVASIVGLGRSLSVDITAEGVETNEQVTLLKAAGCNIVQGFLFGVPQRGAVAQADDAPAVREAQNSSAAG